MKYLVKFQISRQVTEEHWNRYFEERIFSETTTIAEIKEWVLTKVSEKKDFKLFEVILSEPDQEDKP